MADHGDEVAEMLLRRTFNTQNARYILQFIYSLTGKREQAKQNNVLSEDNGKNTVDYNNEQKFFLDDDAKRATGLNGSVAEKMPTFRFAALKAHVLKNEYNIKCEQVKECLLFDSADYEKINNYAKKMEIYSKVLELNENTNKSHDIVAQAEVYDRKREQELFTKLPYKNKEISQEADRENQVVSIKEEVKKQGNEKIKTVNNIKNGTQKERCSQRAKGISTKKPKTSSSKSKSLSPGDGLVIVK